MYKLFFILKLILYDFLNLNKLFKDIIYYNCLNDLFKFIN